ncbi:MAG: tail fiber domain-containing protein [Candidatus Zixiibacteriota bacterium]
MHGRVAVVLGVVVLTGALLIAGANPASTAVPPLMTVQGKLTSAVGTPPAAGPKTFTFKIYDAPVGGTELWPGGPGETQVVNTDAAGLWTAQLGSVAALTDPVFSATERWLEITVDDGVNPPETLSRTKLNTNPYTYRASTVDGASGGTITSKVSIGPGHTNTGTDAFVAGANNTVSGEATAVSGGTGNTASGRKAVVSGGQNNTASGDNSLVCGGTANEASAVEAIVGGGSGNVATGVGSVINGGAGNAASGLLATIGGGFYNRARGQYAVVGGGGGDASSDSNTASGDWSTVGGGRQNVADDIIATVSGGRQNTASGQGATVGGGVGNVITGNYSTIPGGYDNAASGSNSFAGGLHARANHDGCFVWADAIAPQFPSSTGNEFSVRCRGGARFVSAIDGLGNPTAGVQLASGGGSWSSISDRNAKENIEPVDGAALLAKLASIPVAMWNYKSQPTEVRHIGPMAQDFYNAFGVGEDDKHITTIDADGVAFAAIQALHAKTQEIDELRALIAELQKRLEAMTAQAK